MSTPEKVVIPIPISQITRDPRLQVREGLDEETVARYADRLKRKLAMPPPVVFWDRKVKWLADGNHPVTAAERVDLFEVECEVRPGTFRVAFLYSRSANGKHGLNLTTKEKRQAIESLLDAPECGGWSNRRIAEHIGCVSHTMVARVKRRSRPTEADLPTTGRDGRTRRHPTKRGQVSTRTSVGLASAGLTEWPDTTPRTGTLHQLMSDPADRFVEGIAAFLAGNPYLDPPTLGSTSAVS